MIKSHRQAAGRSREDTFGSHSQPILTKTSLHHPSPCHSQGRSGPPLDLHFLRLFQKTWFALCLWWISNCSWPLTFTLDLSLGSITLLMLHCFGINFFLLPLSILLCILSSQDSSLRLYSPRPFMTLKYFFCRREEDPWSFSGQNTTSK